MENLRLWITGLCSAAIISAVTAVLTPTGTMEKSIRTVVSIFLVCALVVPIFKEKATVDNISSNFLDKSSNVADNLNDEVCSQTESYLKNSIENVLNKNKISYGEVVIEMEISDNSVSVSSVTVSGVDEDLQSVEDLLYKETGIKAEVVR